MAQQGNKGYLFEPMDGPAKLPPKPDVALALLQSATSVYVHLDPRGPEVRVPAWFKKQPQLVLQVGMNMAVAIPDLDVGKTALSCTLSFNRRPEFCHIPWEAVYGLVGDDGRGMIWPDSIPPEVASARDSKTKESRPVRGHLRLAHSDRAASGDAGVDDVGAGDAGAAEGAEGTAKDGAEDGVVSGDDVESAAVDVVPPGVSAPQPRAGGEAETQLSGNSNAAPRPVSPSVEPQGAESRGSRPSKLPPYLRVVK
jgi:stringent starvation protein B